jgi:neutral ceramidase
VVRVDDLAGQPIAIGLNYAVQSSVMHESRTAGGGALVTADLVGAACRYVERHYGDGTVALFLMGAAGDQAPALVANRYRPGAVTRTDLGEAGYLLVELLGERLGAATVAVADRTAVGDLTGPLRVLTGSAAVTGQVIPATQDIRPSVSYQFTETGPATIPVWALRIGDIALAGLRPELSAVTGLAIKDASPFTGTLLATMINGGDKYLPDVTGYDRITYEAMNSRYARGSAETVASSIVALLHDLKGIS